MGIGAQTADGFKLLFFDIETGIQYTEAKPRDFSPRLPEYSLEYGVNMLGVIIEVKLFFQVALAKGGAHFLISQ
ncbi:MAG: hypothetical protein DHS20C08_01300 [Rhodomicrobium sp.]|nr:MAG: hypothetical protein DHS20C08_01300 [Rhodomicrobium sp.]